MTGLIHYVPDARGISPEGFATYGLQGVLSDLKTVGDDFILANCERGVDGRPGVLIIPKDAEYPDKIPKCLGYDADKQHWRPVKTLVNGKPQRYIGWYKGDPPGIEDLRRNTPLVQGYEVNGGYDKSWSIPIARRTIDDPSGTFPIEYSFDGDNRPIAEVAEEYESLWKKSAVVWDFFEQFDTGVDNEDFEVPEDGIESWMISTAIEALAVNYRVGPQEMNILKELRLIKMSARLAGLILRSLIDFVEFTEFKKKESQDSLPSTDESLKSSHGEQGESPSQNSIQAEAI